MMMTVSVEILSVIFLDNYSNNLNLWVAKKKHWMLLYCTGKYCYFFTELFPCYFFLYTVNDLSAYRGSCRA